MRLLTIAFTTLLTLFRAGTATGAAVGVCEKELYIYFDVSKSMQIQRDGSTTLELFTQTIDGLLSREKFVESGDRITIVAFAQRPATVIADTTDGSEAAAAVRAVGAGASRLIDAATGEPIDTGDANRTSIGSVLTDIQRRLDPQHRQIFIVASDFADDPEMANCTQTNGRVAHFRALAANARRQLPPDVPLRLVLLTSTASQDLCAGADAYVSSAVKKSLEEIMGARKVAVGHLTNVIARELRKAAADAITMRKGPAAKDPHSVTVLVRNPNPFPVSITALYFSSVGGETTETVEQSASVACGQTANLQADIPEALRGHPKLHVSVAANAPAAPPLEIPSERVTITPPELHVFQNLGRDTYAVELTVDSTTKGDVSLQVSGIPGSETKTYEVDTREGPAHVTLEVPGSGDRAPQNVAVTAASPLYVENKHGTADESAKAHVVQAEYSAAEHVPTYLRWASVISALGMLLSLMKIIPGKLHFWWGIFEKPHYAHIFTNTLEKAITGIGVTSVTFNTFWQYGRFVTNAMFENVLWALGAGGLTLYVSRSLVVALWPRMVERRLHPLRVAIGIRALFAVVIVIVSLCAAGYVFSLLSSALGNSTIYHPARPS